MVIVPKTCGVEGQCAVYKPGPKDNGETQNEPADFSNGSHQAAAVFWPG